MATYTAGASGNAQAGLSIGDLVKTGGGTYIIVAANTPGAKYNPDSGYWSMLYDDYNTTNNNGNTGGTGGDTGGDISDAQKNIEGKNPGAIAAGQGKTVSNPGQGTLSYNNSTGTIIRIMPDGRQYYVNPGDEKYDSIYSEYASRYGAPKQTVQTTSQVAVPTYQPADTSSYEEQLADIIATLTGSTSEATKDVLSYEEALALAEQMLAARYDTAYQQAATQSAQNLDRAGLYNSLYGQQLSAAAQNAVTNEKQSAINELGLNLVGQERDWALQQLGYTQSGLSTAASAIMGMIDNLNAQAANSNDYALQVASMELQKEAQNLEAQYYQGQITQTELENALLQLEIEAEALKQKKKVSSEEPTVDPKDTFAETNKSLWDDYSELWNNRGDDPSAAELSMQQVTIQAGYSEAEAKEMVANWLSNIRKEEAYSKKKAYGG